MPFQSLHCGEERWTINEIGKYNIYRMTCIMERKKKVHSELKSVFCETVSEEDYTKR